MQSKVEKRVTRTFWNDGLVDLLAGVGVVLTGVAWLCDLVPLGAITPALVLPFWKPLRARITSPRLGYVEFSEAQEARHATRLRSMVLVGVGVFALAALGWWLLLGRTNPEWLSAVAPAVPCLILSTLAGVTAILIATGRFAWYAIAFVVAGVGVAILDLEPGWGILAVGVLVLLTGGITLSQFISRHPLINGAES